MPVDTAPADLTTVEDLDALATETRSAFEALVGLDAPTDEQINEAESLAERLDAIATEQAARETVAAERAERLAALRSRFETDQADGDGDGGPEDETDDGDGTVEEVADAEITDVEPAPVAAAGSNVATLAKRTVRPRTPAAARRPVTITASAGVEGFNAGQGMATMDDIAVAFEARLRGYPQPSGDGGHQDWSRHGVVSFRPHYEADLIIDRGDEDQEILERARKESRLPGGSLTAAGGWCAPSETIYDLCTTETLDGVLSVPEVQIRRGGIKFTSGPDFSAIYAAASGFDLTEAQAIAGTPAKAAYEITCPSFTEVRMDAVGIWLKAPILTYVGYPELIKRFISGTLIAHAHRVNAKVIGKMVTAAGAARVYTGIGTTAGDTLDALELVAESLREKYAMGISETMEVVVPTWVLGAVRADLAKRTGQDMEPVTDAQINAEFAARHLSVQFVRDWQVLPTPDTVIVYPSTFQALMYPSGTFVKGVSDVLNLSTMYDSAQLPTNVYTAAFVEQGVLVAKMCNQAALVTLPVCNSGRTGAANFTTC